MIGRRRTSAEVEAARMAICSVVPTKGQGRVIVTFSHVCTHVPTSEAVPWITHLSLGRNRGLPTQRNPSGTAAALQETQALNTGAPAQWHKIRLADLVVTTLPVCWNPREWLFDIDLIRGVGDDRPFLWLGAKFGKGSKHLMLCESYLSGLSWSFVASQLLTATCERANLMRMARSGGAEVANAGRTKQDRRQSFILLTLGDG